MQQVPVSLWIIFPRALSLPLADCVKLSSQNRKVAIEVHHAIFIYPSIRKSRIHSKVGMFNNVNVVYVKSLYSHLPIYHFVSTILCPFPFIFSNEFNWNRTYQFGYQWYGFPARSNVRHTVDVAVEGIVTGMAIATAASISGAAAILYSWCKLNKMVRFNGKYYIVRV